MATLGVTSFVFFFLFFLWTLLSNVFSIVAQFGNFEKIWYLRLTFVNLVQLWSSLNHCRSLTRKFPFQNPSNHFWYNHILPKHMAYLYAGFWRAYECVCTKTQQMSVVLCLIFHFKAWNTNKDVRTSLLGSLLSTDMNILAASNTLSEEEEYNMIVSRLKRY